MKCPKCSDAALAPVQGLPPMKLSQQPYSCSCCRGVWLKLDDAEKLGDNQLGGSLIDEPAAASTDANERTGCCPEGHGILQRAKVAVGEGFHLERCSSCSGVWFDGGEWSRLASHQLLSDLRHFWDSAWQAARRHEKRETDYREWLQTRLGQPLFAELSSLAAKLREHPSRSEALAFLRNELRG